MNYKILNSKEKKEVLHLIEAQWGISKMPEYAFLEKKDGKIFIVNREAELVIGKRIRIDALGLYFAEIRRDINEIRLSIEGSQILGPLAAKNVCEIDDDSARQWLKGQDIPIDGNYSGFVIVKHGSDFMGSGKFRGGKLLNFVPKTRRILAAD